MGLRSLAQLPAALAVLAASSGKLLAILREIRIAQLHLIKDSQASKWGHALILEPHR